MKKLRVLVLMHDDLVPPETVEGYSDKEIAKWATEYDVLAGIEELGHEVITLGVGSDLGVIRAAITQHDPHVTFNLLVHFHGVAVYDMHVVSYLELLRRPYTGCNPRGMMLARDKALSKQIMAAHRIRAPKFHVFPRGRRPRKPRRLAYPLLVKSVNEEASLGISQASVVTTDEKLVERVTFMHETFGVDAIAEEFIEGRELYVGVLGNQRLQTLPVWELPFDKLPEGTHHIATAKLKWDIDYQQKYKIRTRRAKDLSEAQEKEIAHIAKRVYRALGLSGYARMDLRLREDGRVFVLEANPNPEVKYGEDFAESAEFAGIRYSHLLQRLLTLGMSYQAEWKKAEE
jgi:D-alanine-D-alanine ligase